MKTQIHVFSIPEEELSELAEAMGLDTNDEDWQDQVRLTLIVSSHHNP